ncbi:cyclophilin-like domain-containing protein [Morchella snyderi]|nr:cyclophilin-like domain-containing protein [Morchella snyderi]
MASAYNLEPQTNAKVILHTSHGDLDLELWATQTPLTSRNFLQLCLDNYYTGTAFHRLVPNFILQGGDPTGTGHGGEAIYPGGLFEDEFHSRLRFNRRGLVGMANSGRRNDNGSQFFLTLGDTKELTGRNTMFGKVVGDTLYNLVRMGQGECEEGTEKPVYPVTITGAEVVVNPFEDMKPREAAVKARTLEEEEKKAGAGKKAAAGKKKKGKALLSFGGDEEEAEQQPVLKKPKFNTRLVVAAPLSEEAPEKQAEKKISEPTNTEAKNAITTTETITTVTSKDVDSLADPGTTPVRARSPARSPSRTPSPPPTRQALQLAETNAQIAALKQSLRRDRNTPATTTTTTKSKKSLLAIQKDLLPATSIKGRKRKRDTAKDDDETLAALKRFQKKLTTGSSSAPPTTSSTARTPTADTANKDTASKDATSVLDEDDESNLCDLHFIPNCASCGLYERPSRSPSPGASETLWSHKLNFEKDRLGKDLTWKRKNEELVVIDPREKEKEVLQLGRRRERDGGRGGGGGGGGGAEWGKRREGDGGRAVAFMSAGVVGRRRRM